MCAALLLLLVAGFCFAAGVVKTVAKKKEEVVMNSTTAASSWRERWTYYHPSLEVKMKETLVGGCLQAWTRLPDATIRLPAGNGSVSVSSFPVTADILQWWRALPAAKQMRVEPFLCEAPSTRKRPIWSNPGCQLPHYMHPSAPRCQTSYLKWICERASVPHDRVDVLGGFVLPEARHATAEVPPQPYLLTARHAIVSLCGHMVVGCGLVRTTANCMASGYKVQAQLFHDTCPLSIVPAGYDDINQQQQQQAQKVPQRLSCRRGAPFSEVVVHVKRLFIVAEVDDTYVYHVHLEIMPRIIYHLQFLLDNPDVKILVGCDAKKTPAATLAGLEHGLLSMKPFMDLAGLSMDRLVVHTHVYAHEAYLPMEGACQDPVFNTWQILTMRKLFLDKLGMGMGMGLEQRQPPAARPVMMLMKRSANSKHTRNGHDSVRQWTDAFALRIMQHLRAAFPTHRVVLYSDKNETMMKCHACQIQAFAEADVLIGVHGAGLSNMLYMRPNSAVVELAPYGNDGRCLLGGGPFSRLATVLAHNYMIHHPRFEEYTWIVKESASEFNISRFANHISAFLQSIPTVG